MYTRLLLTILSFFVFKYNTQASENNFLIAQKIDSSIEPVANFFSKIIFKGINITKDVEFPIVLIAMAGTAIFLTLFFKFINIWGFGIALRTVKGKYTKPNAPGQITHFQALTAALSATIGLGNIGGVAVAIGLGGPGATFWMIIMGFCGMTTKFAECTLGVKYRKIMKNGTVKGGAMYYLRDGLKELNMPLLGKILAIMFSIFVIGGAFGGGNMYQSNQAFSQLNHTFEAWNISPITFGIILAVIVGLVIIGGIVWIAKVTSFIVPFMCIIYLSAATIIILSNINKIIPAFETIVTSAFSAPAVTGGIVGVLIQGIKRAYFSNEAGIGSASIAHSAVKTDHPASEGFVSLLGPFVDTVVVCTMTALIIIITGTWQINGEITKNSTPLIECPTSKKLIEFLPKDQWVKTAHNKSGFTKVVGLVSKNNYDIKPVSGWVKSEFISDRKGVFVTSNAFGSVLSWFPTILTISIILFAISTIISWSYYGEQGVGYLFSFLGEEKVKIPILIYKILFCISIVIGSSSSLTNILNLSDAMLFAMVIPNLIGIYFLLPIIRKESNSFISYVRKIDNN